ncbi:FAD-binding protein [Amycolatopsis thermoflava]|uniref:FAD-binding protein n=1 Tax=Amycolatopsis thermoflava TaxID=84480 RepID=UPI0004090C06|nr:FAD-binding protein [Amycolatopsis thermoflava]
MTSVAGLGWDPVTRTWTTASTAGVTKVPPLDGQLIVDVPPAFTDASRDMGRMVHRTPGAVLKPGSVQDVGRMVALCREHRIPVAAQGAGHTTHGQRLVGESGLAIDMRTLDGVEPVRRNRVVCEAGALWSDVVITLAEQGFRFRGGLTGYLNLSVGGTLSVGGISPNYQCGAQVDAVERIQVVTGQGHTLWASAAENRDVFAGALAGLGQVGVITQAELALAPLPRRVHTWSVPYSTAADAFQAMRTVMAHNVLDEVYCTVRPPEHDAQPTFLVQLAYYEVETTPPRNIVDTLPTPIEPEHYETKTYLDHVTLDTAVIDGWPVWENRIKPWFDVFLPDSSVEPYVENTIKAMTAADWSQPHGQGFVLLFPHRADRFRRERLRVPRQRSDEFVWLFDVLNSGSTMPSVEEVEQMLTRNAQWLDAAREAGGTLYPIGSQQPTNELWQRHYGPDWQDVLNTKARLDPAGILTPGVGIGIHATT